MSGWDLLAAVALLGFCVAVLALAWGDGRPEPPRSLGLYRPSDTTQAEPTVTAEPVSVYTYGWRCHTCGTQSPWFATYEAREADACAHWISEHEGEM